MTWNPANIITPWTISWILDLARKDLTLDPEEARRALIEVRGNFPDDWPKVFSAMSFEARQNRPEGWPLSILAAHIARPGCGPWAELEAEVKAQMECLVEHALDTLRRAAGAKRAKGARRMSRHAAHRQKFLAALDRMEKQLGRRPQLREVMASPAPEFIAVTVTVSRSTLHEWMQVVDDKGSASNGVW